MEMGTKKNGNGNDAENWKVAESGEKITHTHIHIE